MSLGTRNVHACAAFRVSPFGRQDSQMTGRDYYLSRMYGTLGACGVCGDSITTTEQFELLESTAAADVESNPINLNRI